MRIVRIRASRVDGLSYYLNERVGSAIDEQRALVICRQLREKGVISDKEAGLMAAAVSKQALSVPLPENMKDALRARILKSMLIAAAQGKEDTGAQDAGTNETTASSGTD